MPQTTPPQGPRRGRRRLLAAALLALAVAPASAQLPLPDLPALPEVGRIAKDAVPPVEDVTRLADLRQLRLRELLRGNRAVLEADPRGSVIVRRELIAVGVSEETLAAARAQGFTLVRRESLDGLGASIVTLAPPERLSMRRALRRLQEIEPGVGWDFNHIYVESGPAPSPGVFRQGGAGAGSSARVGLIDGGVAARHPALAGARVQSRAFAGAGAVSTHGTAVASLLVGDGAGMRGAAPGAALYAADVYGGAPTGGSATALARAFSWMAEERVPVVNVSLVGPPNRALETVIGGMIARGHIVVAAVGNDGPAAPPLYPAAYAGVVGVTGVNARSRVLVEAGRGEHVDFAAPGADMLAADSGTALAPVRGTSFASPIVAGLLARRLGSPSPAGAARALADLAAASEDLGDRGRDKVYGAGLVGADLRTPPRANVASGR